MSFKDLESQIKLELGDVFSWGVKKNGFGGYSVPVVLGEEDVKRITDLAKGNDAKNPIYGKTMYLKSKNLSDKQREELLNKGRTNIMVHFTATGIYNRNDTNHLVFKINRLRKLDKPKTEEEVPED